MAKLSVLVQAMEAPANHDSLDTDSGGAVEDAVPPHSKHAIPAVDPVAVGSGGKTTSRKQRIRMGRRLEGAIANRRADAKLPGAARLRRNWFFGVVSNKSQPDAVTRAWSENQSVCAQPTQRTALLLLEPLCMMSAPTFGQRCVHLLQGGPYAEPAPQRLPPALQSQAGQPPARHQAAAAAAPAAGRSTRDAGAAPTVPQRRPQQVLDVSAIRAAAQELQEHVQQEQQLQRADSTAVQRAIGGGGGGAQLLVAGSRLRPEGPRSPALARRAGTSGSTASVAAPAASIGGVRRSPGVLPWCLALRDGYIPITSLYCLSNRGTAEA